MSLQSLLGGDTVTVQQRPAKSQDASAGISPGGWAAVPALQPTLTVGTATYSGPYAARVEDLSASAMMAYAMRGMTVDGRVFTQQAGIGMGMLVTTSDGRKKQVEGVNYNRAIGGMPAFYEVLVSEYRPGA